MSLYVDTSALIKRYVLEPDSDHCLGILKSDPLWITAQHTYVELRRNLARLLDHNDHARQVAAFLQDWSRMHVVTIDTQVAQHAADFAETSGIRSLDAIHLGAAYVVGSGSLPILTYDIRQAQAARALGWPVLGA